MENQKFSFKVVSIGDFVQELQDGSTILNRPVVSVPNDDVKIRYGNEYLLYDKNFGEIVGETFLGAFSMDRRNTVNLKLFKKLDVPIKPDYYIVTLSHEGEKINREYDLVKHDSKSFSKIFSTGYFCHDGEKYINQTTFILQHSDIIILNGKKKLFSAKNETFV